MECEIQVKGVLDAHWAEWFEGLDLRAEGDTTVISGPIPDQAALHGLLAKVRDLGLPLIAVNTVDQGQADRNATLQRKLPPSRAPLGDVPGSARP